MINSTDLIFHILHSLLFLAANLVFIISILNRVKLVSRGQKVQSLARPEARIRSFLLNVLFQQKLFKSPLRGIMHAFIFYGFIVYLIHTTGQMIAGNLWSFLKVRNINPYTFKLTDYLQIFSNRQPELQLLALLLMIGGVILILILNKKIQKNNDLEKSSRRSKEWLFLIISTGLTLSALIIIIVSGTHLYETILHIVSLLVLTGLIFFAFRRWILRAPELDIPSYASLIVIIIIATLMLSTLIGGTAQSFLDSMSITQESNWIIRHLTAPVMSMLGMNDQNSAILIRDFAWWLHIISVYAFMIYVPGSKHAHLIFAPINFTIIKEAAPGQMSFMDLEDEAGIWGAGNVSEFSKSILLNSFSCIECGRCTMECPANRTGKLLDPKRIMTEIKHTLIFHRKDILSQSTDNPVSTPIIGEKLITDEELWSCTSCYACVEACPVGNNQLEAIMDMRRNLVLSESRFPQELQQAFTNMENQSNPWGLGSHTRADWCKDLNVNILAENSDVEYLFWVGCAGAFDERNKNISRSLVQILQSAGINFGILGVEEKCTGDSARRGGNEYLFQTLAAGNIELLNKYGIKKIVTACPHCFNTLKNEYPQMGGNFEVYHHSEFILDLINKKAITLDGNTAMSDSDNNNNNNNNDFVYHDSCYLARYNNIAKEPRELIKTIMKQGQLKEPIDYENSALCCGAGGAQMWMEEKYERVNNMRTRQLLETGAHTIATACPFCITMIGDGILAAEKGGAVEVMDIAEITVAHLKADPPDQQNNT